MLHRAGSNHDHPLITHLKALGMDPYGLYFGSSLSIHWTTESALWIRALCDEGDQSSEISMKDIYKAAWPYCLLDFAGVALIVAFPFLDVV
jgi:hypothetical protein